MAGVPKGKEELTIDRIAGKKGAVTFPHAKHNDEFKKAGGAKIVCKDCHHTLKGDAPAGAEKAQACSSCHVKEGEAQKEHDGKKASFIATGGEKIDQKSVIFHKSCKDGCHKEMKKETGKKLTSCKNCHK